MKELLIGQCNEILERTARALNINPEAVRKIVITLERDCIPIADVNMYGANGLLDIDWKDFGWKEWSQK